MRINKIRRAQLAINKIVSQKMEDRANFSLAAETFNEAYAELRRAAPTGDLHIHLSIEGPDPEPSADNPTRVFRST